MKNSLVIFLIVLFCLSISKIHSQNRTVYGRIITEKFKTIPKVSIIINDTIEVGTTDMNGYFQINIPVSDNTLLFKQVGFEPMTIKIVDECSLNEVIMMSLFTYDFISLKRAERKRKKRYKKLPELHQKAFNMGLFETEYACYKREFESFYLDKK